MARDRSPPFDGLERKWIVSTRRRNALHDGVQDEVIFARTKISARHAAAQWFLDRVVLAVRAADAVQPVANAGRNNDRAGLARRSIRSYGVLELATLRKTNK